MAIHADGLPVEQLEHLADQLDQALVRISNEYRVASGLRDKLDERITATEMIDPPNPIILEGMRAQVRLLGNQLTRQAERFAETFADRVAVAAALTTPHPRATDPRNLHPSRWEDPSTIAELDAIHRRDNGGL